MLVSIERLWNPSFILFMLTSLIILLDVFVLGRKSPPISIKVIVVLLSIPLVITLKTIKSYYIGSMAYCNATRPCEAAPPLEIAKWAPASVTLIYFLILQGSNPNKII